MVTNDPFLGKQSANACRYSPGVGQIMRVRKPKIFSGVRDFFALPVKLPDKNRGGI